MSVFLSDPDVTLYHGDAEAVLRELSAESVHMAATSPPFFGLRDYQTGRWEGGDPECDHAPRAASRASRPSGGLTGGKATVDAGTILKGTCPCGARRVDEQIGLEATPDEWAARLVAVFEQVRRVLRPDGTFWLEVGDSYSAAPAGNVRGVGETSGLHGAATSTKYRETLAAGHASKRDTSRIAGLKPKDLIGAPWLLAFALRDAGWYLRSCIIWAKPNPMPESVGDRPTTAHSYVFLLSKRARYFFDAEALREQAQDRPIPSPEDKTIRPYRGPQINNAYAPGPSGYGHHPNGRNTRSVWTVATKAYPDAHFATWPEELVRRCILAGTSERGVCPECGAPWVREVEVPSYGDWHGRKGTPDELAKGQVGKPLPKDYYRATLGWNPSCDHDAEPDPATVLDPFAGSGTTCLVARKHGRRSIGIDLSADYLALAAKRLSQLSLLAEAP